MNTKYYLIKRNCANEIKSLRKDHPSFDMNT